MKAAVIILFLTCFSLYVLFTRQPDFFDSEIATGEIKIENKITTVIFIEHSVEYKINIDKYFWDSFRNGETVKVIYSIANPKEASYYSLFHYWLLWKEILISIIVFVVLFLGAVSINRNPESEKL